MYFCSLEWRILSFTLLAWDECNYAVVWTFFVIAVLWDWNETDLFQFCGHCWVFHICWHIECNTFTVSTISIWNNSTGILSSPLALFIVLLPNAHLTLYFRMFGSSPVIIPSWLSGSRISFLCSSSVYSCHLFLISSAYIRSIPFLSFIVSIFLWNIFLISLIFLKRSLVFPILLFSSTSLHWSLRKAFLSLLAIQSPEGLIFKDLCGPHHKYGWLTTLSLLWYVESASLKSDSDWCKLVNGGLCLSQEQWPEFSIPWHHSGGGGQHSGSKAYFENSEAIRWGLSAEGQGQEARSQWPLRLLGWILGCRVLSRDPQLQQLPPPFQWCSCPLSEQPHDQIDFVWWAQLLLQLQPKHSSGCLHTAASSLLLPGSFSF